MSAESYWIERHALATDRAKQAEQDREAAIERAERVELLVRSVYMFGTGFLWKRPDGTEHVLDPTEVSVFIAEDQQTEREQSTARAERAEAAIQRVRALHVRMADSVAPRLGFTAPDMCRADWETWPCSTLAALDSTDPVEDAPRVSEPPFGALPPVPAAAYPPGAVPLDAQGRVRALANEWNAMDRRALITVGQATDAVLAALDGQLPAEEKP